MSVSFLPTIDVRKNVLNITSIMTTATIHLVKIIEHIIKPKQ